MSTHVKVLGVLFIVGSALALFGALVVALGVGAGMAGAAAGSASDPEAALAIPFIGLAGSIAVIAILVTALPGLITGIGLLKFKSWARILGIVLCVLALLAFPFGTIIGAYGLWVLLTKETERLFNPGPATTI